MKKFVINIRWPHRCRGTILWQTFTEFGADYVCPKCLGTFYKTFTAPHEIRKAQFIIAIRETDKMLKRAGLL